MAERTRALHWNGETCLSGCPLNSMECSRELRDLNGFYDVTKH